MSQGGASRLVNIVFDMWEISEFYFKVLYFNIVILNLASNCQIIFSSLVIHEAEWYNTPRPIFKKILKLLKECANAKNLNLISP